MFHLGNIVIAASGTKNNLTTVDDFEIPTTVEKLGVQASATGLYIGLGIEDDFAVTSSTGRLISDAWTEIPLKRVETIVLSANNPTMGEITLRVFALF